MDADDRELYVVMYRRCQLFVAVISRVIFYSSISFVFSFFVDSLNNNFIFYRICSEASSGAFPYCNEPGLNFSATNYSEDDADFAGNRRGKASRVSYEY